MFIKLGKFTYLAPPHPPTRHLFATVLYTKVNCTRATKKSHTSLMCKNEVCICIVLESIYPIVQMIKCVISQRPKIKQNISWPPTLLLGIRKNNLLNLNDSFILNKISYKK